MGSPAPGGTFCGGGIFGHQCPENVDRQQFNINIWLNLLQWRKRMLLGSNNYYKCAFSVSPQRRGVRATQGDLIMYVSPNLENLTSVRALNSKKTGTLPRSTRLHD